MVNLPTKTKIVCTLGPSTYSENVIENMVYSGMRIARLNLSHGTLEEHAKVAETIRKISNKHSIPIGILIDIPGVKYRTGLLSSGVIELIQNESITLTSEDILGDNNIISVHPAGISKAVTAGSTILLDDGFLELSVKEIDGKNIHCMVTRGGRLTENRGIAIPGYTYKEIFLTTKIKTFLKFAAEQKGDFIALSTVRSSKDITDVKKVLAKHNYSPNIISKIERAQALDNIDAIIDESDAIMVARGDLGVDIELSRVPVVQKDLIQRCNQKGKPVITATQMLESMIKSPVPTRAEVTDVANAIYDGTDAIMLSGETSVGEYPVETVKIMSEVAMQAENALRYDEILRKGERQLEQKTDDAISFGACRTAAQLNAKLIIAFTESGSTAIRVSKYRPKSPVMALTTHPSVQRELSICWGVESVVAPDIQTVEDFFRVGEAIGHNRGLKSGDLIVLVAGLPIGVKGSTNLLRVISL